jgi:hypothetical protein
MSDNRKVSHGVEDRRLITTEINVLIHLLKCGASHTPIRLPAAGHKVCVELWKLHLVYIWHRQSLMLRRPEGPFYSLTRDGTFRAEVLYLAQRNQSARDVPDTQASSFTPPPR